jgi:hypothetical protein
MAQHTNTWKNTEREIAKWFPNAKRRGADFRGENTSGKTDIVCSGWAIEVKQSKRPTFGLMLAAVEQAERNRTEPDDIPIAVVHKEGIDYKNSLVIMRLEEFAKYFINQTEEK